MSLDPVELTIDHFFRKILAGEPAGTTTVLAAFSGGGDSTALVAGLLRVAPRLGLEIHAAHLDHGLDPDSARRAVGARRLAESLGVDLCVERIELAECSRPEGIEALARNARYAFLERRAEEIGARFIATAHHADDQAETVLLRIAYGSGIEGLGGIAQQRGRLVRPLLFLRRRTLIESVAKAGLRPLDDPTNADVTMARNRFRHCIFPKLEGAAPEIARDLSRLAATAASAAARIDRMLTRRLGPEPVPHEPGVQVKRTAFEALPSSVVPFALALMHRRAGAAYPAPAEARRELLEQLRRCRGGRVGCDCGGGWRWEAASGLLQLVRSESSGVDFAYTLKAPGDVEIRELGLRFRLRPAPVAPWMFKNHPDRAGLADASSSETGLRGSRIEIRNRRPGDRIRPLGRNRRQRLKQLLIDRRVPRRQRDRLPLLVVDGEIAWVPGVTVGEQFRLRDSVNGETGRAWVAQIEALSPARGNGPDAKTVPPCTGRVDYTLETSFAERTAGESNKKGLEP